MATYTVHYEEEEKDYYSNALDNYLALDDIYQYLRRLNKYEEFKTNAENELVQKIFDDVLEIMNERNYPF